MLLLLCVLKLCPEAMNSVKTHLITGTVPANAKLVGFFPEVIITRKEKTKRQWEICHFPIIDGKRRRIPLLLEMCLAVLVEIIHVPMAWVTPIESVFTTSAWSPSSARKCIAVRRV